MVCSSLSCRLQWRCQMLLSPLSDSFQEMPVLIMGALNRQWLKYLSVSKQNIPTKGLCRYIKHVKLVHGPRSSGEFWNSFLNILGKLLTFALSRIFSDVKKFQCLQWDNLSANQACVLFDLEIKHHSYWNCKMAHARIFFSKFSHFSVFCLLIYFAQKEQTLFSPSLWVALM